MSACTLRQREGWTHCMSAALLQVLLLLLHALSEQLLLLHASTLCLAATVQSAIAPACSVG